MKYTENGPCIGSKSMNAGPKTTPPTVKVTPKPVTKPVVTKPEPKPVVVKPVITKPQPKPVVKKEDARYGTISGPSGWSTFWYYDANTDVLVIKQKKAGSASRSFAVSYMKFKASEPFPKSALNHLKSNVYGAQPYRMGRFYKTSDGYSLWKLYCTKPECTWSVTGVKELNKFYVR
jgi:hypothetical protein